MTEQRTGEWRIEKVIVIYVGVGTLLRIPMIDLILNVK